MCKDRNKNKQRAFAHETRQNTILLISWILSHDACIVRVSDKTPFIFRERISQTRDGLQITTWHCRIRRLVCSPSNSQSRSKHRETDEQTGRREQTRNNGQNLPALPCKNTPATAGKQNHTRCAGSAHQPRTCLLDNKTVYLKTGTNGKLWQHKDVHLSVSSCSLSLCECIQNLFPRMCTTFLRIDSASHWTLYNIVFHGMRFCAHRQLMSYLTRVSVRFLQFSDQDRRYRCIARSSVHCAARERPRVEGRSSCSCVLKSSMCGAEPNVSCTIQCSLT